MGHDLTDRVRDIVAGPVAESDADLEEVSVKAAGRRRVVRIVVDTESGLSLDQAADINRAVSRALDESDVMGERPYVLEVSSPGVSRPLTLPRHWRRNVGRLVRITFAGDGEAITGRVKAADERAAIVVVGDREVEAAFDSVARAVVQVEMKRGGGE